MTSTIPATAWSNPSATKTAAPTPDIVRPDNINYPDTYEWLPFVYQGAGQTTTGDNLTASLILPNNKLSYARVYEAVLNRYQIKVQNWLMARNDPTLPRRKLTQEKWLATNFIFDKQAIEIALSSAIDAVERRHPRPCPNPEHGRQHPRHRQHPKPMTPYDLIGLPYRLGATPEKHNAADCLSLARTNLQFQLLNPTHRTRLVSPSLPRRLHRLP